MEEMAKDKPSLKWEAIPIAYASHDPVREIEQRLKDEEWVIAEWSPIHLAKHLAAWYFKDGVTDIGARKVWQDSCQYLYMPRLANEDVFAAAIAKGIATEDFFAYASGRGDSGYLGFAFGRPTRPVLDEEALLIEVGQARQYHAETAEAAAAAAPPMPEPSGTATPAIAGAPSTSSSVLASAPQTQFYGFVELDPLKAKMEFSTIVDEVVQLFTLDPTAKVKLVVEVRAESETGFDDAKRRAVQENCRVLKFREHEFEQ
jgi:hypothetical protein